MESSSLTKDWTQAHCIWEHEVSASGPPGNSPISLSHLLTTLPVITSQINYLSPISYARYSFEGTQTGTACLLKIVTTVSYPMSSALYIIFSQVPTEKCVLQPHPFHSCSLMPTQSHLHIFHHSLALPGRASQPFSPLKPFKTREPVLHIMTKWFANIVGFLMASGHLLCLLTISVSLLHWILVCIADPIKIKMTWWPVVSLCTSNDKY